MQPKKALFIGRFQPPHKGHLEAINYLASKYSQVTVAIGSSKKSRQEKNPFTFSERKFLLKKVIGKNPKVKITSIPDNNSNQEWIKNIQKRFKKENYIICSKNLLVNKLLKKVGYKFDTLNYINRKNLKATNIRDKIRKNQNYDKNISKELKSWMKIKGEKIIKKN